MRVRVPHVVGVLSVAAALAFTTPARAHRLDAQVTVTPSRRVQVESWFSNGEVPHGAKVEVFSADGRPVQEGTLDERGAFSFVTDTVHAMRVVVSAGAGHRRELAITEAQLAPAAADAPVQVSTRESGAQLRDALSGVGFLLGLAAFVISVRNAQKLRRLSGSSTEKKNE